MQVLALYPANSMFTRGYLTTGGQGIEADRAMIDAAGFEVTALID
jgi:biotin synthase